MFAISKPDHRADHQGTVLAVCVYPWNSCNLIQATLHIANIGVLFHKEKVKVLLTLASVQNAAIESN